MSDQVIRKLIVSVGFKVDDGDLDKTDDRTRKTTKSADALEGAFRKAAAALAAFGLASKAMESVKANLDFEKQLGKIQTLVPENIAQVQGYRKELLDMSQRTGKGLGELADATYEVGSAFGVTADTIAITEMAAKAATAAGAETKDAVNLMSAVTLAYGDSTAKANARVGDMAALAANLGKTSLPEMAAGIGQVTGASVQLGVSQQEMFAIIGTAAGVTGPTAQMMTQLKSTMENLTKPTKELQKVYKQLGITAIEQEVAQNGLVPTLEKIIKTTKGSSAAQGKLFSSQDALNLILPITTKLSGRYADTLKAMGKAEGSAALAYDASTQGLAANAHAAELAEAKFAALKVTMGQALAPAYLELIGLAGDLAEEMFGLDDAQSDSLDTLKETIGEMRSFAATIIQIIKIAFAPFINSIKSIMYSLKAMKAAASGKFAEADKYQEMAQVRALDVFGVNEVLNQLGPGMGRGIGTMTKEEDERFRRLGYDSQGLMGALQRDQARMGKRETDRKLRQTKEHFSNWANNLSIGNLVVNTTGLPAQQAEQAANAIPENILTRMFSRAEGVLAPPKVAQ